MPQILKPYLRAQAGRRVRPWSLAFMAAYSALTGALVAFLPAQLMFLLAIPLLLAVAVILWLLPEGRAVRVGLLATLLVWYAGANVLWPSYVSLNVPGLPWINPQRIVVVLLLAIGLYGFSSSAKMRSEIADTLDAIPYLRSAFWIYWAISLGTIVLSGDPAFSLQKWANNQIFWTFMFVATAWLGTRDGVLNRISKVITWSTIILGLEMIYEYHVKQVPWISHIPAFLKIDASLLNFVGDAQARAGTDIYRARGTFAVSLYCAEYLGIVYPMVIHRMVIAKNILAKALLFFGLIAIVIAMWLTNARSAMIGFFMAVFIYGGLAIYRHWRRNRHSLVGISLLSMLPFLALTFLALSLTWGRLHNMTFGGSQHKGSTEARSAQWAMGVPHIQENPIGHGPGRSGLVLGYRNLGGDLTIDTYYLSVILEYGILGFGVFFVIFGGQFWSGWRLYVASDDEAGSFAAPATIGLLIFLTIKAVSSTEANVSVAFIFLGFLFAIARRQQLESGIPNRSRNGGQVAAWATPAVASVSPKKR